MKITRAEFALAAAKASQAMPNKLPQIAVAGRSNVGKSSLINTLANRNGLAKTSRTPGRTRQIVLFRMNDDFMLADLPGYGYAKVSRSIREEWGREIERYLAETETLRGALLIFDARRDLREEDASLLEWLALQGRPTLAAITKMDKFSKTRARQRLDAWTRALDGLVSEPPVGFSSSARQGREEVLAALGRCLDGKLRPAGAGEPPAGEIAG